MSSFTTQSDRSNWPAIRYEEWKETQATLHLWTQIVGKIRLVQTPWVNHSWHVAFYVTARGLTTSLIPYGARAFEMEFDFLDHQIVIRTDEGAVDRVKLSPRTVADLYELIFNTHVSLIEAAQLRRPEVHVPDSVVDFFQSDAFADAHGGHDDPIPIPPNAPVAADIAYLEAIGVYEGRDLLRHFPHGRLVTGRV